MKVSGERILTSEEIILSEPCPPPEPVAAVDDDSRFWRRRRIRNHDVLVRREDGLELLHRRRAHAE